MKSTSKINVTAFRAALAILSVILAGCTSYGGPGTADPKPPPSGVKK